MKLGIQLSARGIIVYVDPSGTGGANFEFTPPGFAVKSTPNDTVGIE